MVSLEPLENNYLFTKWAINSILMHNPTTFEYDLVIPSVLSSKEIIMIGRTEDNIKKFELRIISLKSIIKEIPECKMNIIGARNGGLMKLIKNKNKKNYVNFTDFHRNIETYLKSCFFHEKIHLFGNSSYFCGRLIINCLITIL